MIAILHNIRSSYNVGSIFRTADGAGFEKLYLCGITPAPVDRFGVADKQIAKTALGAQNYLAWEKTRQTLTVIKLLKREGYQVLAIEQTKKSVPYYNFRIGKKKTRLAAVVGYEKTGLPKSILSIADKILEIPMYGNKESLNVAVAFGIAAYHLRQIINLR